MNKTDFDNKLIRINREITSNKTKHLEVQKKVNSWLTKDYNFFLGRTYFKNNDRCQNMIVYQPTLDILELKNGKGTDYVFDWKSKGLYNSKLKPLYTTFFHTIKLSGYKME